MRLLADNPEADLLLAWWLESSVWDGMSGSPAGPPEWPFRGGYLRQPARLVEAVQILKGEFQYVKAGGRNDTRETV